MNIIENIKNLQINAQNKTNQSQFSQSNVEMLKTQLKFVCDKIEETLNQAKNPQKEKEQHEVDHRNIPPIEESFPLVQTLNNYKEQTQNIKNKLDSIYRVNKLDLMESEIKKKREQLRKIQSENKVLFSIKLNQQKGIEEFENKYYKREEVIQLTEKLRTLREESKISRDYMKGLEAQVKGQINQISVIKEKCKIIKENIDYKKKQQMKEVQNMIDEDNNETVDISELEEQKANFENQTVLEERGYRSEILIQLEQIDRLKTEINILALKVKQIEQSKKINDLKMKEINKINNAVKKPPKPTPRTDKKEMRLFKMDTNGKQLKAKDKDELDHMSKTPVVKMSNKMIKKPFEIHKFNYETNYTNIKPPKSDNHDMMKEIEFLKNDIQNVIKQNKAELSKIVNKPKERTLIDKINEQSAILPLDPYNNSDLKQDYDLDYLDEIETERIDIINESNNKRKPSLGINFGGFK